jgi:hypothetical protein
MNRAAAKVISAPGGYRSGLLASFVLCLVLAACAPPESAERLSPTPFASGPQVPADQVESDLREAFQVDDPFERRERVLAAAEAFLRTPAVQQMDDRAASTIFTDIAFSSRRLRLRDPGFIRRSGGLVVVGLPDGLGMFLYDLDEEPGSAPLELTPWTVGLSALEVNWLPGEFGVSYATLGSDQAVRVHFLLATQGEEGWQVAWPGDEEPGWWFNATNGSLSVSDDLERLVVEGEAPHTTLAFQEQDSTPRRRFQVEWTREGDLYQQSPPESGYATRQEWLWSVALPSAYATLVEFVERMQLGQEDEAAALAAEPGLLAAARTFGLHLPTRRYLVTGYSAQTITFRDQQDTYMATFEPPETDGGPWQIVGLRQLGINPPTPTPETEEPPA